MAKQSVVVLGAGGFIGRRIVAALAATDWATPIAVSRHIGSAQLGVGIQKIALDATDAHALESVISTAAGVVSCVAGSAQSIIGSGTVLFQAAARMPSPPRVVYLSSVAAYGSAHGLVSESSPLLGDLDEYSASKAEVERIAAAHAFAVRLRPGIVYGPESDWWSDQIARLLVARRLGDLGDCGEGICNLVHVEDVADAVLQSLRLPNVAGEAFNLGSPEPPTWNQYLRRYAESLGATPIRRIGRTRLKMEVALYGPALKVMEPVLKVMQKLRGRGAARRSQPAIRPWLTKLCRHDIRMQVSKAEERLGMRWRPLESGLEECAAWFLARGRTR